MNKSKSELKLYFFILIYFFLFLQHLFWHPVRHYGSQEQIICGLNYIRYSHLNEEKRLPSRKKTGNVIVAKQTVQRELERFRKWGVIRKGVPVGKAFPDSWKVTRIQLQGKET